MSADEKKGPNTHTTVSLERPPDWAIKIMENLVEIRGQVGGIEANVQVIEGQTKTISARVGVLETRLNELQERQDQHSDARDLLHQRVEGQSATDLEHEAALAKEREERAALAAEVAALATKTNEIGKDVVAVKKAVVGVLENPRVRAVAKVIFVLAMGYAATKDVRTPPAPPPPPPATQQP